MYHTKGVSKQGETHELSYGTAIEQKRSTVSDVSEGERQVRKSHRENRRSVSEDVGRELQSVSG